MMLNGAFFLQLGSPLFALLLRMFGASISADVVCLTTQIVDLSYIRVGRGTVIEQGAVVVPHKRERDFMQFSHLNIGAGCSVRTHAFVMHDVVMKDGVELLPLSLALPGQVLETGRRYRGVPSASFKGEVQ